MTEEAVFYRRFVADVRRLAADRAPASVAEIELRVRTAIAAPPGHRERHWARVVGAVSELLAGIAGHESIAAARLRAFVRENADLDRPRDVSITDFRFVTPPDEILTDRSGRSYLVFGRIARAKLPRALDEVVAEPTRLVAEWSVYGLCGGAAIVALWFAFIVPI